MMGEGGWPGANPTAARLRVERLVKDAEAILGLTETPAPTSVQTKVRRSAGSSTVSRRFVTQPRRQR
jgi:hypothetical protein